MKEEEAIPHLFRCPISLELLKDPVTVSTGQTYERSSIQQWLDSGHRTCPVTMQLLPDPAALLPNLTLRHLIRSWLRDGAGESFGVLPLLLDLAFSGDNATLSSSTKADRCRLLSKALSPAAGELCAGDEGISTVVDGLISYLAADEKSGLTAAARETLRRVLIPFSAESESLSVLIGDERFVSLFRRESSSAKANLCRLMSSATSCSPANNLISGELLREVAIFSGAGSEFSAAGVELLWTLSGQEAHIAILAGEEAVVNGLISYLSAGGSMELATDILRRVLAVDGAREELVRNPKGVSALVKRVFVVSGDQQGSESAVAVLTWLCRDSPALKETAISAGILTQLLLLLQSQCNGRTKTKARTLLTLLR